MGRAQGSQAGHWQVEVAILNAEASKLLMDLLLLCKGMMNRVLGPGWDELPGGVCMGLRPSSFHRPLLAVPFLL